LRRVLEQRVEAIEVESDEVGVEAIRLRVGDNERVPTLDLSSNDDGAPR
jgi:hypothetical protein